MTVALFSWGYWGWGNATRQLVQAADAAEAAHGFEPPVFVDVRLRRQGRARGFGGNAFRDLVGASRYLWMEDLGNEDVATGAGGITIRKPEAVAKLLELALQAAKSQRRVIFYCACEYPWVDGKRSCHRDKITDLLLAHAKKLGRRLVIEEWPGGDPVEERLEIDRKFFSAVMRGRMSVPFEVAQLFAGLPWGSQVSLHCKGEDGTGVATVGPARFAAASKNGEGFWYLPVMEPAVPGATRETLIRSAEKWRKARGLHKRETR
jgi:hypothetical protein